MKKFMLSLSLLSIGLLTGCDDKVPDTKPQAGGIIIGIAVGEIEKGQTYIQMLEKPEGAINVSSAIPLGSAGEQPAHIFHNHLYSFPNYSGQSKSEVVQYEIQEKALVKKATLPVPASMYFSIFESSSQDKGWLADYASDKLIEFTPSTFKATGKEINLRPLAQEGVLARPSLMIERDGLLFVALNQAGENWMPNLKQAEMAVIDVKTGTLLNKIVDTKHELSFPTRPVFPGTLFVDESGDIYIACIGSFGATPGFYGGFLRIKKGARDFDPDYAINFKDLKIEGVTSPQGSVYCPVSTCYMGNGKVAAYVTDTSLDVTNTNQYTKMTSVPVVIDLKTKTAKRIEGIAPSDQGGIAMGMHQGKLFIANSNKQLQGFYCYDPQTEKITGPVITTTGAPNMFWSRTPNK